MDYVTTTPEIAAVAIPNYLCKLLVSVKSRSDSHSVWSKTLRWGEDCTISMQALFFAVLNKCSEAQIHEVRSQATTASRDLGDPDLGKLITESELLWWKRHSIARCHRYPAEEKLSICSWRKIWMWHRLSHHPTLLLFPWFFWMNDFADYRKNRKLL